MLDAKFVIFSHNKILETEPGLPGFAASGPGGVEAAINRVENQLYYSGLDDVFGIAAWYAVVISRGHTFNDANKRTGLVCALAYLEQQGIVISTNPDLENLMVDVGQGGVDAEQLASYFSALVNVSALRELGFEMVGDLDGHCASQVSERPDDKQVIE